MTKICIVEDDKQIRDELTVLLERNGYDVCATAQFDTVVSDILTENPDLVLLDLNLPCLDGHILCRELREHSKVPIIIVTSRDSDLDELMSMNLGADDFITKPYRSQILLARIATVLRRTQAPLPEHTLAYQEVEFFPTKNRVVFRDQSADLTKNEMQIMQMLMQRPEEIISRTDIQNELWQSDEFVDDNTLTVNVNRLRNKLEAIGLKNFLHTKRGQGYFISL